MTVTARLGPHRLSRWLIPLLFLGEAGFAQNAWYGSLTFTQKLKGQYGGCSLREDEKKKNQGEYHASRIAGMIVQYCAGKTHIEKAVYRENHWGTQSASGPRGWCSLGPMSSSECRSLIRGVMDTARKPQARAVVGIMPGGQSALLSVGGWIPFVTSFYEFGSGYVGCGDEVRTWATVTTPFSLAGVPEDRIKEWEERFKEVTEANTTKLPSVSNSWLAGSIAEFVKTSGPQNSVVQGEKILLHETTSDWKPFGGCGVDAYDLVDAKDYDHSWVARWFFTNSRCEAVRNELEGALQIKKAFETLHAEASAVGMSGEEYNNYVKGRLEDSTGVYSSPMGTDTLTCDWVPGEEYDQAEGLTQEGVRDRYYSCMPGDASSAVFSADMAHERVHQETCKAMNKAPWDGKPPSPYKQYMDSMENYINDEVKAYDVKIRHLCGAWEFNDCGPPPDACRAQ